MKPQVDARWSSSRSNKSLLFVALAVLGASFCVGTSVRLTLERGNATAYVRLDAVESWLYRAERRAWLEREELRENLAALRAEAVSSSSPVPMSDPGAFLVPRRLHFTISRRAFEHALAAPAEAARGARIVPAIKNGEPIGFRLYAIRSHSVYRELGLKNGDTISSINDHPLGTVYNAIEVYGALKNGSSFRVGVIRRGAPFELRVDVTDE